MSFEAVNKGLSSFKVRDDLFILNRETLVASASSDNISYDYMQCPSPNLQFMLNTFI